MNTRKADPFLREPAVISFTWISMALQRLFPLHELLYNGWV